MKKVVLGLSGGVDSAVAALLLKQQGYDVIAIFMKNWDDLTNFAFENNNFKKTKCSWQDDYNDAQKIAKQLSIPIYLENFEKIYWNKIFLKTINDYKSGQTPNPDIFCNKIIKFNEFKKIAFKKYGADFIATGHYAKLLINKNNNILAIPKDKHKDQTYFLSTLSNDDLNNVLFPLDNLTKKEVRNIAKKNNFINFEKKDSTGLCFIGERNFKNFLKNYISIHKGPIVDFKTKKTIGTHDGTEFFTIGQRKGINVSSNEPYFVYKKNSKKILSML